MSVPDICHFLARFWICRIFPGQPHVAPSWVLGAQIAPGVLASSPRPQLPPPAGRSQGPNWALIIGRGSRDPDGALTPWLPPPAQEESLEGGEGEGVDICQKTKGRGVICRTLPNLKNNTNSSVFLKINFFLFRISAGKIN